MIRIFVGAILSSILLGCSSNEKENYSSIDNVELITNNETDSGKINSIIPTITNENGPPFTDTCNCLFEYIGGFHSSKNRYDLIICGKDWNPKSWSCSYTFGEIINNEFPPDTTITDFRIHLVDIKKSNKKIDLAFFESDVIQKNLIVTQRLWPGDKFSKCKFDPNKTGKYPKPEQWIE